MDTSPSYFPKSSGTKKNKEAAACISKQKQIERRRTSIIGSSVLAQVFTSTNKFSLRTESVHSLERKEEDILLLAV